MHYKKIILGIKKDLIKNADEKYRIGSANFFKEHIKPYGVRIPQVRKIADEYFARLKDELTFNEFIELSEQLLKTGWFEDSVIAFQFLSKLKKNFNDKTFKIFESWLSKYISNWAHCDFLCTDLIDHFIQKNESYAKRLYGWTVSKNRWLRRASMVCFVRSAKKGLYLDVILKTAKTLKSDKEDLVLKGAGWVLREAAKKHRKEVYDFLIREKQSMGRVMLRYAIEHFPKDMKNKVMA